MKKQWFPTIDDSFAGLMRCIEKDDHPNIRFYAGALFNGAIRLKPNIIRKDERERRARCEAIAMEIVSEILAEEKAGQKRKTELK